MTTDREIEQPRAEFEAWAKNPNLIVKWGGREYSDETVQAMWEAWQASALRQPKAGAVPEDWRLVPVEPSAAILREMARAGGGCTLGQGDGEYIPGFDDPMSKRVYAAMLAGAPQAQPVDDVARLRDRLESIATGDVIRTQEQHDNLMSVIGALNDALAVRSPAEQQGQAEVLSEWDRRWDVDNRWE